MTIAPPGEKTVNLAGHHRRFIEFHPADNPTELLPLATTPAEVTIPLRPAVPATYITARPDAYIGRHRPRRDPYAVLLTLGLILIGFAIAGLVFLRQASDLTGPAPAPAFTTVPAPIPALQWTGGAR